MMEKERFQKIHIRTIGFNNGKERFQTLHIRTNTKHNRPKGR